MRRYFLFNYGARKDGKTQQKTSGVSRWLQGYTGGIGTTLIGGPDLTLLFTTKTDL